MDGWLLAAMWVQLIQTWFFVTTANAPNHWTITPPPRIYIYFLICMGVTSMSSKLSPEEWPILDDRSILCLNAFAYFPHVHYRFY